MLYYYVWMFELAAKVTIEIYVYHVRTAVTDSLNNAKHGNDVIRFPGV